MGDERWQRVKGVLEAALEQPVEARPAFLQIACGDDLALRAEVESLLDAKDRAGAFLSEPAALPVPEAAVEGRRIGPYRILAEAGRGGMGLVYRAVRDDDVFRKTVALKLVRGGAGAEHLRRLAKERQILARLQHPHIATILDGGTSDEGQPYLVMEYVDGQPLDAYCEDRGLGTRERLSIFRTVCAAVHHAHQNLVIHRDLKPSNILVTAEGQVKLLDFGIAKLLAAGLDPEDAPTATLLPVLTPAYASPEQVRGQPVTTASDVYSLGVVLYELLTGTLPYAVRGDSLEEAVRVVCETQPPPPSTAVRADAAARKRVSPSELRGDIDTIVLRALSKEPRRRYASAQELAEDVRRYLEGRPVLARADTFSYRAGKFVKRHRMAVAAAAVVMVSLLGGMWATVRQRRVAEDQRARAERRFADVRKLANSFLFEFHDAIRDLPGSTPARQLVVKKALEYLDSLAQESGGDPLLQAELAAAYKKVGDVQGNPLEANMGDPKGAIASYRKEVAIREALSAGPAAGREVPRDLAAAYYRLGLLQDEAGDTRAGVEFVNQSLRLAERLVAQDAADAQARRLLARAHEGAGLLALKSGNPAAAAEHQKGALAIWESEVAAAPTDLEALRGLHLAHGGLARTLRVSGRLPESTDHYRKALEAAERRAAIVPVDAMARRDLSNGNGNFAVALYKQGDFGRAALHIAKSLAYDEEMLRADPRNSQVQRDLSWDYGFLAELALARGRPAEALSHQRRALAIDQARAESSGSFQARKDVAEDWSAISDSLTRLKQNVDALAAAGKAVALYEELRAANPTQLRVQQLMALQYGQQAALMERLALRRDACEAFRRSLALWSGLEPGGGIDAENVPRVTAARSAVARCGVSTVSR